MTDRSYDLADLDYERIGRAVFRLVVISRALGHASVAGSVRDYLMLHGDDGLTSEQKFARDVIVGRRPSELVAEHELSLLVDGVDLPPLDFASQRKHRA